MNFWVLAWVTLGFSMLLVELFNPGIFFALSIAFGAFAGALSAYFNAPLEPQVLIVIVVTGIVFMGLSSLLAKFGFSKTVSKKESTNVDALVGQIAIALNEFHPFEKGSVKIGGEIWPAVNQCNLTVRFNDKVKIVKVEGNHLFVLKIDGGQ